MPRDGDYSLTILVGKEWQDPRGGPSPANGKPHSAMTRWSVVLSISIVAFSACDGQNDGSLSGAVHSKALNTSSRLHQFFHKKFCILLKQVLPKLKFDLLLSAIRITSKRAAKSAAIVIV